MLDIKQLFDPDGLLNPGKIFPAHLPVQVRPPAAGGPDSAVYAPQTAQQLAEALRGWMASGYTVGIRGNGTLSRWPVTDKVLSTQALQGITVYARDDLYVTVGAGTRLSDVQQSLRRDGLWVPLASPWPQATVGGLVSTNLNAPQRMLYGGVRDVVLAATVVLPDGRVIRAGRPLVKDVAGYDLRKLFVGAHGTLGAIADVTLKLAPLPRARVSLVVLVDDWSRGLVWGAALLRECLAASSVLLCRGGLVPGVAGDALVYTVEGLPQDVQAEAEQARRLLLAAGAPAGAPGGAAEPAQAEQCFGAQVWADFLRAALPDQALLRLGVPPKNVRALMAQPTLASQSCLIADLPNGQVYVRTAADVIEAVRRDARALGGYGLVLQCPESLAGRVDRWGYAPDSLDLMRRLKAAWDPQGLLNPGVFIV
jgi:D-lactate dehydrogenase (cytochrome)